VKGLPETDEEILGKDGKGVVWVYEGYYILSPSHHNDNSEIM
jgi:hypothetical protein